MIEQGYRRDMEQITLAPEQMAEIAQAMAREKARPRRGRRVGRAVLLAAALCLLLSVSALALSPTLRERLAQAMGSFGPYSQRIESVSTVDQGYEIRVLSAVTDRYRTKIYLQVTDLTGTRLVDQCTELTAGMERGGGKTMLLGQCVDYDPETHTALFELHNFQEEPSGLQEDILLTVYAIQPQHYEFTSEQPLPKELVSPQPLASITLEDGQVALAPGQTVAQLEGVEQGELSSMGFAADGSFQVLFRLPEGALLEDSYLLTNLWLDGEVLRRETDEIHYTMDGAAYAGISFPDVPPDNLDRLELDRAYGTVELCGWTEGNWTIPFPVENLSGLIELTLTGAVGTHDLPTTLALTPLGAILNGSYDVGWRGYQDFAIVYDDGTRMTGVQTRNGRMTPGGLCRLGNWDFSQPVELDRVTALELGEWYISLAGEDAGTVYPMDSRP